ncbi:hypothetical protein D3C72_2087430 [compost metagenome]
MAPPNIVDQEVDLASEICMIIIPKKMRQEKNKVAFEKGCLFPFFSSIGPIHIPAIMVNSNVPATNQEGP